MQAFPKVIHRVRPYQHEDLTGFLMRVAARNHLLGPSELLAFVTGTANQAIHLHDLPKLAELCRNTVEEVHQLSGFEWRISGEDRTWRIAGEWITKSVFISLRRARICPGCLKEQSYIRGHWSLSLYSACAKHESRLLEKCPNCQRRPLWNRRHLIRCGCGFDLSRAPLERAGRYEIALAKLLAYRSLQEPHMLEDIPLNPRALERLAGLSLDGICKTVWFLGHCLADIGNYGSGHGRKKPGHDDIDLMTERAFEMLQDWPDSIGSWLSGLVSEKLDAQFSATAYDHLLAPVQHYFQDSVTDPELKFLAAAFEQHVRRVWIMMGRRHYKCEHERQLELDFA